MHASLQQATEEMLGQYEAKKTKINHDDSARIMTGGSPAAVQSNDSVMEFMDATNENLNGIDRAFDSTAVFEKEYKHHIIYIILIFLLYYMTTIFDFLDNIKMELPVTWHSYFDFLNFFFLSFVTPSILIFNLALQHTSCLVFFDHLYIKLN